MNCPSCRYENLSDAVFCNKCGTHLVTGKAPNAPDPVAVASETLKNAMAAARPGVTVAVQTADRERQKLLASLLRLPPRNKVVLGLVAAVLGFGNFGVTRPTLAPFIVLLLSVVLITALYLLVIGVTELIIAGLQSPMRIERREEQ